MDPETLGKTIRKMRVKAGLTQYALGLAINVSDKTVSKWESGNGVPELGTLVKLADYFKVTVDDLLRGKIAANEHTEFLYIMDASGSMHGVTDDVIGGFNSFLEEQQAENDVAYLTTVMFNSNIRTLYESLDMKAVDPIDRNVFRACGSTALFDAIGESVMQLDSRVRTNKVMVTIMTDGYENASRYFTRSKIRRLIRSKQAEGWDFVFAGANIDVDKVGDDIGIDKDKRLKFVSDSKGTRELYSRLSDITSNYRRTGKVNVKENK